MTDHPFTAAQCARLDDDPTYRRAVALLPEAWRRIQTEDRRRRKAA